MTNPDRRAILAVGVGAAAALGAGAASQAQPASTVAPAAFNLKPLTFDPAKVPGLSEKLIRSHYDNNYSGAVKRLSAIRGEFAKLDVASAPTFLVNGLKREELLAWNSMVPAACVDAYMKAFSWRGANARLARVASA
jgi:Fe-Mn family superoxide dismutase